MARLSYRRTGRGPKTVSSIFADMYEGDYYYDSPLFFRSQVASVPRVNVHDKNGRYILELAVPGMSKDDLEIKVENRQLLISGKKPEAKQVADEQFTRKEFDYSSFQRAFALPFEVEEDNIEAEYKKGILRITLHKKEVPKNTPPIHQKAVK